MGVKLLASFAEGFEAIGGGFARHRSFVMVNRAEILWQDGICHNRHLCITFGNAVTAGAVPCAPMRAARFCGLDRRRRDSAVAIYSLHVKTVSRSAGRSVVAAAAYRAAETIADERLGVVWDFTRKYGVLHSEIMAPADAPEWASDRAELWNTRRISRRAGRVRQRAGTSFWRCRTSSATRSD